MAKETPMFSKADWQVNKKHQCADIDVLPKEDIKKLDSWKKDMNEQVRKSSCGGLQLSVLHIYCKSCDFRKKGRTENKKCQIFTIPNGKLTE